MGLPFSALSQFTDTMKKLTKEERIAKRAKAKEIRAKIRPNIKIQAKTPANYEVPKLKARDAKNTAAAKKALLDNAAKAAKKSLKAGYYRVVKGSKVVVKKSNYIVKEIGGAKNGGARRVCLQKKPAYYAAQHNARRTPLVRAAPGTGKVGDKPKAKLRPSLTPGTVVIIVAGVHKAKRAVFLKQLAAGLCGELARGTLLPPPPSWTSATWKFPHTSTTS